MGLLHGHRAGVLAAVGADGPKGLQPEEAADFANTAFRDSNPLAVPSNAWVLLFAEDVLTAAAILHPSCAHTWFALSDFYTRLGQMAEAGVARVVAADLARDRASTHFTEAMAEAVNAFLTCSFVASALVVGVNASLYPDISIPGENENDVVNAWNEWFDNLVVSDDGGHLAECRAEVAGRRDSHRRLSELGTGVAFRFEYQSLHEANQFVLPDPESTRRALLRATDLGCAAACNTPNDPAGWWNHASLLRSCGEVGRAGLCLVLASDALDRDGSDDEDAHSWAGAAVELAFASFARRNMLISATAVAFGARDAGLRDDLLKQINELPDLAPG
jgi:hypothetical protein